MLIRSFQSGRRAASSALLKQSSALLPSASHCTRGETSAAGCLPAAGAAAGQSQAGRFASSTEAVPHGELLVNGSFHGRSSSSNRSGTGNSSHLEIATVSSCSVSGPWLPLSAGYSLNPFRAVMMMSSACLPSPKSAFGSGPRQGAQRRHFHGGSLVRRLSKEEGMSSDSTAAGAAAEEDGSATSSEEQGATSASAEVADERDSLLAAKEREVADLKDGLLRAYAEMENLRERMKRENDAVKKFAVQDFAKSILDVADNLGRAIGAALPPTSSSASSSSSSSAPQDQDPSAAARSLKSLLDGVVMTEKQLLQILKKFGVERLDPAGQPFDPNLHSAMFEVVDSTKEAGTVAHVMKVGYTLHDRVIRPAEVGVVKRTEEAVH